MISPLTYRCCPSASACIGTPDIYRIVLVNGCKCNNKVHKVCQVCKQQPSGDWVVWVIVKTWFVKHGLHVKLISSFPCQLLNVSFTWHRAWGRRKNTDRGRPGIFLNIFPAPRNMDFSCIFCVLFKSTRRSLVFFTLFSVQEQLSTSIMNLPMIWQWTQDRRAKHHRCFYKEVFFI